jgi:hypothetical protein
MWTDATMIYFKVLFKADIRLERLRETTVNLSGYRYKAAIRNLPNLEHYRNVTLVSDGDGSGWGWW